MARPRNRLATRQRGIAMLVILALAGILASVLAVQLFNRAGLQNERNKKTTAALAQAKAALIGYAITYGDTHSGEVHGYLPCPDTNGNNGTQPEGSAQTPCGGGNISVLGRLPWKTLDLSPLRDGNGECLWYAVSGTFKNNPKTDLMNWDNSGLLEVLDANGTTIAQNVVAVIFAPGAMLGNQNRAADGSAPTCGGNYAAANYLDNGGTVNNAAVSPAELAISQFHAGITPQINDQVIFITRDDIFNARNFRAKLDTMTRKVAECIAYFGTKNTDGGIENKSIPWPAQISLTNYADNLAYNDRTGLSAGRVPYKVNTARNTSHNSISNEFLLQSDGANCPGWNASYPWWDNWKDHLFYAIGERFEPDNDATSTTSPCGDCLKINGSGQYAAVIMFAGQKLSALNQTRVNKSIVADYLEGRNASNYASPSGDKNYQTSAASSTFNDILYCIQEDLSVIACP